MKDFINKLISSLDNHTKGFSGRKLSAFAIITCIIVGHVKLYKAADWIQHFEAVLIVDFSFVLACLGLTTWQAVKKEEPKNEVKEA